MSSGLLPVICVLSVALVLQSAGCGVPGADPGDAWSGSIDTLESGVIVIQNTGESSWSPERAWRVVEEIRIGSDSDDDAVLIGHVESFDVDARGRIFALDSQSQEIYVFDASGELTRSVGGQGAGPGEFEQAHAIDLGDDGRLWVMEMQHGQLTIIDENGDYLGAERVASTGWSYSPYPGGMDHKGRYNAAVIVQEEDDSHLELARYDQSFVPIDTIKIPSRTEPTEMFEYVTERGATYSATIPFRGSFSWRFSPGGNFWTLQTKKYELSEVTGAGETLRRVTLDHDPLPVTESDREQAIESLSWLLEEGGKIDRSKIPKTKPVVSNFFCDDEGNLWVMRIPEDEEDEGDEGQWIDLFGSEGRFLGGIRLPFSLRANPEPIVRSGFLYGITTNELGAEIIVRARIIKP